MSQRSKSIKQSEPAKTPTDVASAVGSQDNQEPEVSTQELEEFFQNLKSAELQQAVVDIVSEIKIDDEATSVVVAANQSVEVNDQVKQALQQLSAIQPEDSVLPHFSH